MLQFLSEHLDQPKSVILARACIDPADIEDASAFEILGIPLPVKDDEEEEGEEVTEKEGAVLLDQNNREDDDL
jgi:hypothetical protein